MKGPLYSCLHLHLPTGSRILKFVNHLYILKDSESYRQPTLPGKEKRGCRDDYLVINDLPEFLANKHPTLPSVSEMEPLKGESSVFQ